MPRCDFSEAECRSSTFFSAGWQSALTVSTSRRSQGVLDVIGASLVSDFTSTATLSTCTKEGLLLCTRGDSSGPISRSREEGSSEVREFLPSNWLLSMYSFHGTRKCRMRMRCIES
jgi:hypothetical protein